MVVRSRIHWMSLLSVPTAIGKSDVFFLIARFVLADIHFLISEWPSAKEKPHAPLCNELGRSLQPVSSIGSPAVRTAIVMINVIDFFMSLAIWGATTTVRVAG